MKVPGIMSSSGTKSLSQQLADQRAAKKAKRDKRTAAKKTKLHTRQSMPVMQNRLLLVKDPTKPTESELLNSQLKLYLYLSILIRQHDLHCIRYFTLMLATVRVMNLIQPNPRRMAWVETAEQELKSSATSLQRRTHFKALTALTCDYAESLVYTSRTFIAECDNHAVAVMSMHIIGDMLAQPDWVFNAFGKVCAGKPALKTIAEEYGVSDYTLKRAVLDLANLLFTLYYCAEFNQVTEPGTITSLRQQGKTFMRYLAKTKETAREQVSKIMAFNRLFGTTLIDLAVITNYINLRR